jgi:hypothetical protein
MLKLKMTTRSYSAAIRRENGFADRNLHLQASSAVGHLRNLALNGVELIDYTWPAGAAMMAGQPRFFTVEERHAAPSAASDPLERLSP